MGNQIKVVVKRIEPQTVELFDPQDNSLGFVNEYELGDVKIQIAKHKLSGYYVKFEERKNKKAKDCERQEFERLKTNLNKNQTKMKNVHLLQTETYLAKLQLDRDYGHISIIFDDPCVVNGQDFVGANLYITSDELYTIGWYLDSNNYVTKTISDQKSYWEHKQNYQKIILTTDPRLIKDSIQAIDDEFLDWFCENPDCEFIPITTATVNNELLHKINIGFESWRKEESKQETLLGKTISKKDAYELK